MSAPSTCESPGAARSARCKAPAPATTWCTGWAASCPATPSASDTADMSAHDQKEKVVKTLCARSSYACLLQRTRSGTASCTGWAASRLDLPATPRREICETIATAHLQWQKVSQGVHCRPCPISITRCTFGAWPVGWTHEQLAHTGAYLPVEVTSAPAMEKCFCCACETLYK